MRSWTNIASTLFGYFAKARFPSFMQRYINAYYVRLFGIDLGEFLPLGNYKSLNALFTRELQQPRVISEASKDLVSPCDALITQMGLIDDRSALQIKGKSYDLTMLLGEQSQYAKELSSRFEQGHYINFYLSPKDYHCYHAPCTMQVLNAFHVAGRLLPVNLKALRKHDALFCHNERVVLECQDEQKRYFYLVFVGALNVGGMRFGFDDRICTNSNATYSHFGYSDLYIAKGQKLGNFEMGSTVVLVAQKGFLSPIVDDGDVVKFGQTIAHLNARSKDSTEGDSDH